MKRVRRATILSVCVLFGLSACSATRDPVLLPAQSQSQPRSQQPDRSDAHRFGVGLAAAVEFYDYQGGSDSWSYCARHDVGSHPCPPIVYDKKLAHFTVSRSYSFPDDATATFLQDARAGLGVLNYAQSDTVNDFNIIVPDDSLAYAWSDVLHVESSTLSRGTPVVIDVSLALTNIGVDVDCIYSDGSEGYEAFHGSGTDPEGYPVGVVGRCAYYDAWYFDLGEYGGPEGTTDTGTIETAVGESIPIGGNASVYTLLQDSYSGATELSGTATWSIVGITKGATYRTASGRAYHSGRQHD